MIVAALVLLMQHLRIGGGDDVDFVRQMADQLHRPIAIMAEPYRLWPKIDFEYQDEKDLKSKLASRLDLQPTSMECIGASQHGYPENFFMVLQRAYYGPKLKTASPVGSNDRGIVTVEMAKPADLGQALSVLRTRHVSWHWFFKDAVVVVNAKAITESAYVQLIADCIGAKVVSKKDGDYFDFDPDAYRRRGIQLLEYLSRSHPEPGGSGPDYDYSAAVLRWIKNDRLRDLLDHPDRNTDVTYDASDSIEIQDAARRRLRNRFPVTNDGVNRDPSWKEAWDHVRDKIDWNQPVEISASAHGLFGCRYHGYENGKMFYWNY